MNRQTAFPDGENFSRVAEVIVEIEGHVIETRADETTQEAQLGRLQHVVGVQPASNRLAVREPEPETHGGRHENAVPAESERTDLERDRAGRAKHTGPLYGRVTVVSNKSRISGQIR